MCALSSFSPLPRRAAWLPRISGGGALVYLTLVQRELQLKTEVHELGVYFRSREGRSPDARMRRKRENSTMGGRERIYTGLSSELSKLGGARRIGH